MGIVILTGCIIITCFMFCYVLFMLFYYIIKTRVLTIHEADAKMVSNGFITYISKKVNRYRINSINREIVSRKAEYADYIYLAITSKHKENKKSLKNRINK